MESKIEVKITGNQGIGSFYSPLTNVPYGYTIIKNGEVIDHREQAFSSYSSTVRFLDNVLLKDVDYKLI